MTSLVADRFTSLLRVLLAVLMLWAGVSKIANPTEFLGTVYAYAIPFPRLALQFVAMVLPWIELTCGLLLLVDRWIESALLCTSVLMVVFWFATGQAWFRGLNISCGCFNLEIFGLHTYDSAWARFFDSVRFAFFRNLILTSMTIFLFGITLRRVKATNIRI
jgi:putative oxidoreductase